MIGNDGSVVAIADQTLPPSTQDHIGLQLEIVVPDEYLNYFNLDLDLDQVRDAKGIEIELRTIHLTLASRT